MISSKYSLLSSQFSVHEPSSIAPATSTTQTTSPPLASYSFPNSKRLPVFNSVHRFNQPSSMHSSRSSSTTSCRSSKWPSWSFWPAVLPMSNMPSIRSNFFMSPAMVSRIATRTASLTCSAGPNGQDNREMSFMAVDLRWNCGKRLNSVSCRFAFSSNTFRREIIDRMRFRCWTDWINCWRDRFWLGKERCRMLRCLFRGRLCLGMNQRNNCIRWEVLWCDGDWGEGDGGIESKCDIFMDIFLIKHVNEKEIGLCLNFNWTNRPENGS